MTIIPDQPLNSELPVPGEAAPAERLLTSGEAADVLQVDPQTVNRWGDSGKLTCGRTPNGHRRFREREVLALAARLHGTDGPGGEPR